MVKTLVEHIRTVHFSLLVLCLILLSASPHQKDLNNTAYDEAQSIAENLNQKALDQMIEDFLETSRLGSLDQPSEKQQVSLKPGERLLWPAFPTISLDSYRAAWAAIVQAATAGALDRRFFPSPWLYCQVKCTSTFTVPKEWTFSDVAYFLENAHMLVPRPEQAAISTVEQRRTVVPKSWNHGLPADATCTFEVGRLLGTSGEPDREFIEETSVACEAGGEKAEWITSFYPGIPVHKPLVCRLKAPSLSWRENARWVDDQSFNKQFSNLAIVMNAMPNLTIGEAVNVLKTRAESTPEAIQVFGAKVPIFNALLIFGALMLGCQFYMWAHIDELRRLLRSGPIAERPTGFIGFYPGAVTSIIVGATLTVLPLTTIVYVLERSFPFWLWKQLPPSDFIATLAVAISSVIGVRTILLMRNIRDMLLADTEIQVEAVQSAQSESAKGGC